MCKNTLPKIACIKKWNYQKFKKIIGETVMQKSIRGLNKNKQRHKFRWWNHKRKDDTIYGMTHILKQKPRRNINGSKEKD